MTTASSDKGIEQTQGVFVLEDQPRVLDALLNALKSALPDTTYVFGEQTIPGAWHAIERAEKHGRKLIVAIVDQVEETRAETPDREWGIGFLRELKKKYPDAFRVMFSAQSVRTELQNVLEERLIHHFAAKDRYRSEEDFHRELTSKIARLIQGDNVLNVQSPSPDREFDDFMKQWVKSLPDGEDTEMRTLSGQRITAGDLLEKPELREKFRNAYLATRLDRMVTDVSGPRGAQEAGAGE